MSPSLPSGSDAGVVGRDDAPSRDGLGGVAADVAWHGSVIAFLADPRRNRVSRSASLTIRDHPL